MEWAIDLSRPTFIKVHRKYLSPDTLDKYYLPWEWDKVSYTTSVTLTKRILAGGCVCCEDTGDVVLQAAFATMQPCRRRPRYGTKYYASGQPLVCYCPNRAAAQSHQLRTTPPPFPYQSNTTCTNTGYLQHNSEYIIIKKYIDNDFQDELFRHTKMLKEKKTITSGYVKDTEVTTTLRPREKSSDQMYLVRSKSRSRGGSGSGTNRKSWMFT